MKSIKVIVLVDSTKGEKPFRLHGQDKFNQYLEFREISPESVQGIMGDTVVLYIPQNLQSEYEWVCQHYDVVFYEVGD